VEDRHVGDAAAPQRATGQRERARGRAAHALDHLRECQHLLLHELCHDEPERGLQPDEAERRILERLLLLVVMVRRMVRRDDIEGPVTNTFDYGCTILGATQWRVDLRFRAVLLARL